MKAIKIINWVVLAAALLVCVGILLLPWYKDRQSQYDQEDARALRSVIGEAYININKDPEFENTATEDQPMKIPPKYYTYVESVQGDGPVYVFVDVDGCVDAYFGSPEKVIGYYVDLVG